MKIEIEKSDLVVIENGKVRIEGARRVYADGSEVSLDCDCEDYENEYIEGTDDKPDPYEPDAEVDPHPATSASHNYTPSDMVLGKPFPDLESMQVVGSIEANKKEIIFPAGKRDIITIKEALGSHDHVILDYELEFEPDFMFNRGGKIGCGFGIGKATTGCADIEPDGASVRFMWRGIKENGEYVLNEFRKEAHAMLYIYHQDRIERCGDNFYFGKFEAGRKHRLTLEVAIKNSSDYVNLWFDGKHVLSLDLALIQGYEGTDDWILYWQSFTGGSASDSSWHSHKEHMRADISEVIAYAP